MHTHFASIPGRSRSVQLQKRSLFNKVVRLQASCLHVLLFLFDNEALTCIETNNLLYEGYKNHVIMNATW